MRTLRAPLAAAALALALHAAPAAAAPAVNGVFDLPGVHTNGQLVVGPDGNVWVSLEQAVGRVQPSGAATALATGDLGNTIGFLSGGVASAGGFVWVSQTPSGAKKALVRIPPASPSGAAGVTVPGVDAGATAMAAGPDGNVWVALAGKIVKFSPSNPAAATTYPVAGLSPRAITASSDGTLWVTDTANGGRLLNVTTAGAVTPYTVGGQPQFAGAGPAGQVAFGNPNSTPQQIGLLSPGGSAQTIDRPSGSDPFGVTFGADGAFWVAEFAGNRLARVTTGGQLTTLGGFPLVPGQGPRQLTAGPGNTLWVTLDKPGDPAATKIARVTGVDPPPPPAETSPPPGAGPPATTPPPAAPPAAASPPDTTAPAVSAVSLSRTRLPAGTRSTTLRFTSAEAGAARVTVQRRASGRRRAGACVRPTPRLRRARRCTRFVRVGVLSAPVVAGTRSVPIDTRRLGPGRYRVVLVVRDAAGNASAPVARAFTITKRRR